MLDKMKSTPEGKAWADMFEGRLDGLADLLRAQRAKAEAEQKPFTLPAFVGLMLLDLIEGEVSQSSFRVAVGKHPDLGGGNSATAAARLAYKREALGIAIALERHGAFENCEAAVAAVMAETGKSRATVMRHWSEHKGALSALADGELFDD